MLFYLNKGFVVEQALVDLVKRYFDEMDLDSVYKNFHIYITNDHPFAHIIIEGNTRSSDLFPSVVITTDNDEKVPELSNIPVQVRGVKLFLEDLIELNNIYRDRTSFDSETGIEEKIIDRNGNIVKELIPGYIQVIDNAHFEKLKAICEQKGFVYGLEMKTQKRDRISIEIWSENNQLKNEIYEKLRLYLSGKLLLDLKKYEFNDVDIFDKSIRGDRSSNFNLDFDVLLHGSHLSFEIDYSIVQYVIDTDIDAEDKDLIMEVVNHVKE